MKSLCYHAVLCFSPVNQDGKKVPETDAAPSSSSQHELELKQTTEVQSVGDSKEKKHQQQLLQHYLNEAVASVPGVFNLGGSFKWYVLIRMLSFEC